MNPGALARGTIDEFNLLRRVQVGLVEVEPTNPGFKCKLSMLHIKSAKPAAEVFRVKELNQKRHRVGELAHLATELAAGITPGQFELISPVQAVEAVCASRQVSPAVREAVLDYVREAEASLGT